MACAKHSPQAQESLVGGNLAARNQMSCGRRISCHQRKDTADHRLFMGQFLISNKDRGTIVTPLQPYTGTEVQVQNTHRDEFKTHGTISCFTEKNAKKEKTGGLQFFQMMKWQHHKGHLLFFVNKIPQIYLNVTFFLQSSFGSGSVFFLMPLFQ